MGGSDGHVGFDDDCIAAAPRSSDEGAAGLGGNGRRGRKWQAMMWMLGGVVIGVGVYLAYVLIHPEKF